MSFEQSPDYELLLKMLLSIIKKSTESFNNKTKIDEASKRKSSLWHKQTREMNKLGTARNWEVGKESEKVLIKEKEKN